MSDNLPDIVRLDQSESPDRTRDLGNLLAECVRALNYSTLGDAPGLEYAGDVYSLLGAVGTALERLPQLLRQSSAFVKAQAAAGTLGDDKGRDPVIQAGMSADLLEDAAFRIGGAARQVGMAQNDISGLYMKGNGDAQD